MKNFSIHDVIEKGWNLTKTHFWLMMRLLVITWGVSFASNFISEKNKYAVFPEVMVYTATIFGLSILSVFIQIGYLKIAVRVSDGEEPRMSELFSYTFLFWRFILSSILVGLMIMFSIAVIGGLALFLGLYLKSIIYFSIAILAIIPIIYIVLTYSFVQLLIVDKNLPVMEAFKKSAEMSKGHKFHLLALGLVLVGINIIGALCVGVGLFVSVPVSTFALIATYKSLLNEGSAEGAEAPFQTITLS